jgi:hypothetical protein
MHAVAGAPVVSNAKYVVCDQNGTWCYQHGGETNTKSFTNARLACQALNGDLAWWWVSEPRESKWHDCNCSTVCAHQSRSRAAALAPA